MDARAFGLQEGGSAAGNATALADAIAALTAAGGGVLTLPAGTFAVTGFAIPTNITVVGAGNATKLMGSGDAEYVIKLVGTHSRLRDVSLNGQQLADTKGIGIVPADEEASTIANQLYCEVSGVNIFGFDDGIVMRAGPKVGESLSGCYYNRVADTTVLDCVRGMWLRDATEDTGSLVNRNQFTNVRFGSGRMNVGAHIEAGDTNTFVGCTWEGIDDEEGPLETPTGIYLPDFSPNSNRWNRDNRFIAPSIESVTRAFWNGNRTTNIVGIDYDVSISGTEPEVLVKASLSAPN